MPTFLKTQEFLQNGGTLEELENSLKLRINRHEDGRVQFNYHQIDSPKMNDICMECRSLILDSKNNWDYVSLPFHRFFNRGEALEITEDFPIHTSSLIEKIDGSLISIYWFNDEWKISSRGTLDAEGEVGWSKILTFNDLVRITIKESHPEFWNNVSNEYSYYFELTSPENRNVTPFIKKNLWLLGMRDRDGKEKHLSFMSDFALRLGVLYPKVFNFNDELDILKMLTDLNNPFDEGYVICDYTKYDTSGKSFRRLKMKNPGFVAISHLKDKGATSLTSLVLLSISGEVDEFVSYFPEFEVRCKNIRHKWETYLKDVDGEWDKIQQGIDEISRKDYAEKAIKSSDPNLMFWLYDNRSKTCREYFDRILGDKNKAKRFAKQAVTMLGIT